MERITQKHVALDILPEHHHFVAEALLGAVRDVLGEAIVVDRMARRIAIRGRKRALAPLRPFPRSEGTSDTNGPSW